MDIGLREETYRVRIGQYLREGHDRFAAAAFVASAAGPLEGPALDVGTGRGLLAMALAERGLDVVSVDVSAEDQELATRLAIRAGFADRIRFLHCDAAALPFPDGHFGCAVMMDVLHHLKDATPVLTQMARLVRPGGWIVLADFTEEGFALVARVHQREGGQHPRSDLTMGTAQAILAVAGWVMGGETVRHLQRVAWYRKG